MALRIKKGDVLLFSSGGLLPKIVIHGGQKILNFGRGMDSSIIHAGIVVKGGDAFSCRIGFANIEVAHAVSTGVVKQRLDNIINHAYRSAMILRRPDSLAGVAKDAAGIAERWAKSAQGRRMGYSNRKALMAGFGSASYGPKARARALEYHNHANTDGGPPSLHDESIRNKSVYCSMFIVAAYQAALGPNLTAAHMNIDARNCTPMKMADFFRSKGFVHSGHVFRMNNSNMIQVVDRGGTEIPAPMQFFN